MNWSKIVTSILLRIGGAFFTNGTKNTVQGEKDRRSRSTILRQNHSSSVSGYRRTPSRIYPDRQARKTQWANV